MSVQSMAWAFDQELPTAPKFVLVCIANAANEEGDNCFPGQKPLARMSGMSERSVRTHIQWLEDNDFLKRSRRYRIDGYRTSDRYILRCCPHYPEFRPLPEGYALRKRH